MMSFISTLRAHLLAMLLLSLEAAGVGAEKHAPSDNDQSRMYIWPG